MTDLLDIAPVIVEGALDCICGRPRTENPYSAESAADAAWAWMWGWDEARMQFEHHGQEELRRWLEDAA